MCAVEKGCKSVHENDDLYQAQRNGFPMSKFVILLVVPRVATSSSGCLTFYYNFVSNSCTKIVQLVYVNSGSNLSRKMEKLVYQLRNHKLLVSQNCWTKLRPMAMSACSATGPWEQLVALDP